MITSWTRKVSYVALLEVLRQYSLREISCMNPSPSVVCVENSHLSGPNQHTHSSHILLMFTASVLDLTSLALMIHPTH